MLSNIWSNSEADSKSTIYTAPAPSVFSTVRVKIRVSLLVILACGWSGPIVAESTDPWESVNRAIWNFNDAFDAWILKPSAISYKAVTPDVIERGISNFFRNIGNLPTSANNLLQGKPGKAGQDLARFVFNLTFGGLGIYDFSSDIGLPYNEEDFGQTLGVWGVPQGPYMILPFIGPSTVRDTIGFGVDQAYEVINDIDPGSARNTVIALQLIDLRAQILQLDNIAPGDQYLFYRDAYLQRREALVVDGRVNPAADDAFLQDDF